MNMSAALDAHNRIRALDHTQSFIVKAPAGSGKTELLTQRYLKLLAHVERAPEEILAVTFTRKAASEMRQRILSALQFAADTPEPPEAPQVRTTWSLAKNVLARDQQCGWQIQENPNRLPIVTIDALCAYIVNRMPVLSQSGGTLEIADFPEKYYEKAVSQLLKQTSLAENWAQALMVLLAHLDNKITLVQNLLVTLLEKRDQWLIHLAKLRYQDLEGYLNNNVQRAIEAHLQLVSTLLSPATQSMLCELLPHMSRFPAAKLADYPTWLSIAQLLTTGQNTWRKAFNQTNGFPSASESKIGQPEKIRRQTLKKTAQDLVESLSEQDFLLACLNEIKTLPSDPLSEQQLEILNALGQLLPVLVAHLQLVFQEAGKVDFTEVALRAQAALGEELAPTDVALSLDYQFRHILIDEYQDTSLNQYRLFEKLVTGWQAGDGRTLFLVGDPQQSIYRFRGAEVSLFLHTQMSGLGAVHCEPLVLSMNFRSQAVLVDWVNKAFSRIFPAIPQRSLGAVCFDPAVVGQAQQDQQDQAAKVAFHAVSGSQASQVINLIQETRARDPATKIAVLVRAKKHLFPIIQALKQAGIPFEAQEVEHLAERLPVQDLISLLRAMTDLTDRIAWLSMLRAPWLGLSLVDLTVITDHCPSGILWEGIKHFESLPLSQEALLRLAENVPLLDYWLMQRHRRRLSEYMRGLWEVLKGRQCYEMDRLALEQDLDVVFGLIDQNALSTRLELENLMASLAKLYADVKVVDPTATNIHLMTIHKAKGLEFDTVIVPSIQAKTVSHTSALLLWYERSHETGVDLFLAPRRSQAQMQDSLYRYLETQIRKKDQYESARLLYVAATRAKRQLHWVWEQEDLEKSPHKGSFLDLLSEAGNQLNQDHAIILEKNTANQSVPGNLRRIKKSLALPQALHSQVHALLNAPPAEKNAPNFIDDWSLRSAGTVFHRAMQSLQVMGFTGKTLPSGIEQGVGLGLRRLGLSGKLLLQANHTVIRALNNVLGDPAGRWILNGDTSRQTQRQSEWPLSVRTVQGVENMIIDLTFKDKEGVRWVIDYKLTVAPTTAEEVTPYRAQLEKYQRALVSLEGTKVKAGLYFPLSPIFIHLACDCGAGCYGNKIE